jgi:hypothetical protein
MTGIEIAALVIAAIGTGVGIQQSHQAAEEADDQAKIQSALAEQKRVHDLRLSINQARVQRAQGLVSGLAQTGTSGGGESSAVQGALGSAQTQMASEIGFSQTVGAAYDSIYKSQRKQNNFTANAATAGAVATFANQFGQSWQRVSRPKSDPGAVGFNNSVGTNRYTNDYPGSELA